jgi:hypothetical protein
MLDGTLRLYRVDGTLVAKADTASLGETINKFLPAGKYVAIVQSHGSYGDVGQYTLYGYQTAVGSAPSAGTNPFSTTPIKHSMIELIEDANA